VVAWAHSVETEEDNVASVLWFACWCERGCVHALTIADLQIEVLSLMTEHRAPE